MTAITIEAQIACIRREIGMRARVYPKWVRDGRMPEQKSKDEIAAMEAVLKTLLTLQESGGELPL
jgi:ribulose kinase